MRTLLAALFCGLMITANAQNTDHPTQKIGYAESDYILSQLPDFKKIESELKTHGAQLENQMKAKYDDYQAMDTAYHDLEHTLQATLCCLRIIYGHQRAGAGLRLRSKRPQSQSTVSPSARRIGARSALARRSTGLP